MLYLSYLIVSSSVAVCPMPGKSTMAWLSIGRRPHLLPVYAEPPRICSFCNFHAVGLFVLGEDPYPII
jgi:hypothetical protein